MDSSPHAPPNSAAESSVSELVKQASEQLSALVRDEPRSARAEMKQKGKRFGVGGGLFGGAGLVAVLAAQAAVATAIIALGLVWPLWLSALVVTAGLFAVAWACRPPSAGRKSAGPYRPRSDRPSPA